MIDEKKNAEHSVSIIDRERIRLTGVTDALAFDEENISAQTQMGTIILRGQGLRVEKLNVESGELSVEGFITALEYDDGLASGKNARSFWGKLFK